MYIGIHMLTTSPSLDYNIAVVAGDVAESAGTHAVAMEGVAREIAASNERYSMVQLVLAMVLWVEKERSCEAHRKFRSRFVGEVEVDIHWMQQRHRMAVYQMRQPPMPGTIFVVGNKQGTAHVRLESLQLLIHGIERTAKQDP